MWHLEGRESFDIGGEGEALLLLDRLRVGFFILLFLFLNG